VQKRSKGVFDWLTGQAPFVILVLDESTVNDFRPNLHGLAFTLPNHETDG
jgi:hypothetical protein